MVRLGILAAGCWLLLSGPVQAQFVPDQSERAQYISLSALVTVSNPIEDHGDVSGSNTYAGYAKTGIGFQLQGSYMSKHDIGGFVRLLYNQNPLNESARERNLSNATDARGTVSQISTDYYQEYGLIVGPSLRKFIAPNLELQVDIGVGLANSILPQIGYTYVDSAGTKFSVLEARDEVAGQIWSFGGQVNYFITQRTAFRLHVQYLRGRFRHDGVSRTRSTSLGASDRSAIDVEKRWALINVGLGVVITF